MPRAAMRRNLRGSMPSRPVAGQPDEQAPQVRQRLRFPPSGSSCFTLSMNMLFFLPLILIASSAIPINLRWNCQGQLMV